MLLRFVNYCFSIFIGVLCTSVLPCRGVVCLLFPRSYSDATVNQGSACYFINSGEQLSLRPQLSCLQHDKIVSFFEASKVGNEHMRSQLMSASWNRFKADDCGCRRLFVLSVKSVKVWQRLHSLLSCLRCVAFRTANKHIKSL